VGSGGVRRQFSLGELSMEPQRIERKLAALRKAGLE